MRLIDAEVLLKKMEKVTALNPKAFGTMLEYMRLLALDCVKEAPTIEAKPVVHCKDCKYNVANRQQDPLDITDYTDIVCDYFMTDGMEADDFCSKGVKIPVISMEDVPKIMEEMVK